MTPEFGWLVAVGFAAQLVNGSVGMGYGLVTSACLAALGFPPALTSAAVHGALVATTGVSSASQAWFRNLDRKVFFSLLVPGVIGGVVGASLLAHVPTRIIQPFVWGYLLITSLFVLGRVILRRKPLALHSRVLGAVAGFLDAIGGGGWGTITTSTLIARGLPPRFAIGTANAVEFFVTLAISVTLWFQIGPVRYDVVLALLIGGAAAAPLSAWLTSHTPARAAATAVGLLVFLLGAAGLFATLT
ncbi:MAG TPA: sulfite exporter TauE/SafE family protein [Steroidobacteraceae bacterium]|nr:sulfite exporter TauE/SafE family protein [Steroidobacteraceae bacterium]